MTRERELDLVDDDEDLEDDVAELLEDEHTGRIAGFVSWLLLGALLGVGLALLLAPEPGAVTRRRLGSRLHDMRDDAREHLDDLRDQAGQQVRKQRRRIRRRLRERRK